MHVAQECITGIRWQNIVLAALMSEESSDVVYGMV
jgi:hypothetical protein